MLLGGGRTFRRWGLLGGSWVCGCMALRDIGYWSLPISLPFPWAMRWADCFTTHFHQETTGPKNLASQPWTKASETMYQSKLFLLLRWSSQVFCHSDKTLTHRLKSQLHWSPKFNNTLFCPSCFLPPSPPSSLPPAPSFLPFLPFFPPDFFKYQFKDFFWKIRSCRYQGDL